LKKFSGLNVGVDDPIWQDFALGYGLDNQQLLKFYRFYRLLYEFNQETNLTCISGLSECINYHFKDSLAVKDFVDLPQVGAFVDVGTGAGFPAIPLKILFPDLFVVLIEVKRKKIEFLDRVIQDLQLENVEICPLDWRTFLRKTDYDVNLFFARASVSVDELMRIFKPTCYYKNSKVFYWASLNWVCQESQRLFFRNEFFYNIKNKKRKLVLFSR